MPDKAASVERVVDLMVVWVCVFELLAARELVQ